MMKSNEIAKFFGHLKLAASLITLLILPLGTSYGDTNVLTNPGFESGTTSWAGRSCSITTVTSPVHSGLRSGRAYGRTETWQGIKQDMMGKMVEGETYQISGWVRISGATSATVKVTFEQVDGSGTNYYNVDSVTANNSNWVQLSDNFTLNVTGTLSVLDIYFEGPPSGVDIYVDDAVVFGPEAGPPDPNATGQIDANIRHQMIEGFGAAGAWYENYLTSHTQRETLYDLFFDPDELGLDIYRVRNTHVHDTGYMSNTGTIVGEALERNPNLKILISSWSPPGTLKSNGDTIGGGDATLAGGPSSYVYSQFADWWADSITSWSGYGVDADYISIQNECDYDASWESCRFDPTQNSSVAGYDQAFEAVYSELYSRFGSSMPKMLAPETSGFSGASGYTPDQYLSALSATTNPHVYGCAHHLYNCYNGGAPGCGDDPDQYITNMNNFNSSWGSKPLFQTEYEHATDSWPDAHNIALLLHNSLVEEEVSGYIYWDLFWNTGGLVTIPSYGSSTYTINSDFYGFKHFSAFIYSGWQRVDASTNSSDLRISAYINPDDDKLSVVILNTSTDTDIDLDLSFTGFSITSGNIYRSSQTQNCVNIGSYNGTSLLTLPSYTITTLSLSAPGTPQQTLSASSTAGGSVTTPGEGDFQYPQNSNATIIATPDSYYHFDVWTGTAITAGKVADPYSNNTTVLMDANYTVVANFEADPPDITPPSPDPMTWASLPSATGSSTITMTATTATDDSPPVEYYFECTTDGDANSGWQEDETYIAQGLNPLTSYMFRVKARDSAAAQNETGWSTEESATTEEPPTDVNIIGSWTTGLTHTAESGTDRALIFVTHWEDNVAPSLTSVTYGGQTMTKVIDITAGTSGFRNYVAAFVLDEAGIDAATNNTFVPSWGNTPSSVSYDSVFLQNVDQADIIAATDSASTTTGTNPIVTGSLSTASGDMVILAAVCGNNGSYTLNNGFTEGNDQSVGSNGHTGVTGHKLATGVPEAPSATHTDANRQAIIGFVVQAAGEWLYGDFTGDGVVDFNDLPDFFAYWLLYDCNDPDDLDINEDCIVNFYEFAMLADNLLKE